MNPAPTPYFKPVSLERTGRRTALAGVLTDPENPLTARVMVNRMWQHHFGKGIVGTPSDFGLKGDRPTHPELLDWLAREFVQNEWSIKKMHKLIMLSATYRQSSAFNEACGKTHGLRSAIEMLGQVAAGDILQNEIRPARRFADVVDLDNVRVL